MASSEVTDPRASLRRFRAANGGAGAKIRPAWTVGDDSDDEEGTLTVQNAPRRKKLRRRNVARQVPYEGPYPPPPFRPPPPPPETGSVGGGEGFPSVTASAEQPEGTGDSSEDDDEEDSATGGMPEPTSLLDFITASLSDGPNPTSVSNPEATDDIDSDSDSEDESTSVKPTGRSTRTSGGLGPSQTATDPLSATTTGSGPDPDASAEAAKLAEQQHHREVETALIVVGCIAGLICIGIGIWFIIRRRSRKNKDSDPNSRLRRFKLPFGGNSRDRAWEEISDEKLYGNEKDVGMNGNDLLAYLPDKPAAAAQTPTPRIGLTQGDGQGYYTVREGEGDTFGNNNSTTFLRMSRASELRPPQAPYSPTESSLSSAFGNGTYIPPTPLHPPPRVQIQPPTTDTYSQRDTVYTQSSEASSIPRFRTVNSWVRQQTRKRADEVPEQGYGLMAPDGEVPRMVQHHVVRPEGVGFAR